MNYVKNETNWLPLSDTKIVYLDMESRIQCGGLQAEMCSQKKLKDNVESWLYQYAFRYTDNAPRDCTHSPTD